jgi:hypothetical protein
MDLQATEHVGAGRAVTLHLGEKSRGNMTTQTTRTLRVERQMIMRKARSMES